MERPVVILMVGLPGVGKTTRARQLEVRWGALRLTPDEWMVPLFGSANPPDKRDVLEGRLLWVALRAAGQGLNVIVDFGLWSTDERSALRRLFGAVGADCRIEYLTLDHETQRDRVRRRFALAPDQVVPMSEDELRDWRRGFEEPSADELAGGAIPSAPPGWSTWWAWAAERWPTLSSRPPLS